MNINSINIIVILISAILIIGAILLYIFYLLNLQRLLKEISPSNRLVPPSNVWLMFIPFFSIVYAFILYPKISDSVRSEYKSRGRKEEVDYGKSIGITMAILAVVSTILRFSEAVPFLSGFIYITSLVLFIIFWVKMAKYKNELKALPGIYDGISSNPDLLD